MTEKSKFTWKEDPASIYKRARPGYTKLAEPDEPLEIRESRRARLLRSAHPLRQTVKQLSWAQRNSRLVIGLVTTTAVCIFYSKFFVDIYKGFTEPPVKSFAELQLHPSKRPE